MIKYLPEDKEFAINELPHAGFSSVPYQHPNKSGTAYFFLGYFD
ncbi:MAG: hypothetical protein ABL857_08320 [Rickettsiales bacterium]